MLKVNHMVLCPKPSLSGLIPETHRPLETWDGVLFSVYRLWCQVGTKQVLLQVVIEEDEDPAAVAAPSPGFPRPWPCGVLSWRSADGSLTYWVPGPNHLVSQSLCVLTCRMGHQQGLLLETVRVKGDPVHRELRGTCSA